MLESNINKKNIEKEGVHERFNAYRIPLETTGIQSEIELGDVDGVSVIKKTSGSELPVEIIVELFSIIPKYRQSLINAGLQLPVNLSTRICEEGLELIDEFIAGKDLNVMIKMKDSELSQTWIKMIGQVCNANDGTNRSRAMIDVKPANFIKSSNPINNTLYYIDFFPPMLEGEKGIITPWFIEIFKRDRDLMSFNFGDTRGQITKLLAISQIYYPDMYEYLKQWTLQTIEGNLPNFTVEYIREQTAKNFPDMKFFYSGQDVAERIKELKK